MPSITLTGPSPNPDLDHTVSQNVKIVSQGADLNGLLVALSDITVALPGTPLPPPSFSIPSGASVGNLTIPAGMLANEKLYRLTVSKPITVQVQQFQETRIIGATLDLDTRRRSG